MGFNSAFKAVKRPKLADDHSTPYSTGVNNERNYASTPPTHLHDAERDFAFTFTFIT